MTDDLEPLLDTAGVATLLSLHPKTVTIMAAKKELPAIKVGGVWRFRPSELRTWLNDLSVEAAAQ